LIGVDVLQKLLTREERNSPLLPCLIAAIEQKGFAFGIILKEILNKSCTDPAAEKF